MPRRQLGRPKRQSWRTPLAVAVLAAVLAGCGESVGTAEPSESSAGESATGREVSVDGPARCDHDVSSDEAKGTIERVGGLQQPTWSVRFAESTAAGVVVLVDGDLEDAEARLFGDYGVAVVVGISEDQTRSEDFEAVREAVREICGG
ncbi:hypothetical protein WBG06_21545 [Nocardioides sp. CCNWLW239]|uniref:hypothetical protein n=1 Tax=Nocardioides sp. CCNWLW239 TaxID=3128902 RepID=UPI00301B09C3